MFFLKKLNIRGVSFGIPINGIENLTKKVKAQINDNNLESTFLKI